MVRSLWTAASGMNGQQSNIDTVANNLSNVNTTGFKKQRVEFEDLLYQTVRTAGTPATEDTLTPVGVQMGHGVKVAATQRMFNQGNLQNTENVTDLAIQGEGFFRVLQYDGSYAYTRDGSFKIDSNGQIVNSNGLKLMPEIILPEGFLSLFKVTAASGDEIQGQPGFDGMGKTIHKFLEMSNVSAVNEMVNMIVAQRAYEFSSKAIQTSDNMLGTAVGLKR